MMGIIFIASTSLFSSGNTSRFLVPLLKWFHPEISLHSLHQVQFFIRKAAHLAEYALLALLFRQAIVNTFWNRCESWNWHPALLAVLLSGLYAMGDEFHQSRVATRTGSAMDVLIDCCGAGLGILIVWLLHVRRTKEPVS